MGIGNGARMTVGVRFQYVLVKARQKALSSENSGFIVPLRLFRIPRGHQHIKDDAQHGALLVLVRACSSKGKKSPLSGQYLPLEEIFPSPASTARR